MATQTLIPTQDVADGTGLDITALLATPTATGLLFANTGRERLIVVPGTAITTTVASGSNTGEISTIASWSSPSAGVLDVPSSSSFPSSGTLNVAASGSTTAVVTYTGTGSGTFTGCTYVSGSPSGTVSTGGTVSLASEAVTVDVGALVDGQTVNNFPSVTLTASHYVQFGPYHSVLDQNGTNQIEVTLSSVNNVQIVLLQGIGVF